MLPANDVLNVVTFISFLHRKNHTLCIVLWCRFMFHKFSTTMYTRKCTLLFFNDLIPFFNSLKSAIVRRISGPTYLYERKLNQYRIGIKFEKS